MILGVLTRLHGQIDVPEPLEVSSLNFEAQRHVFTQPPTVGDSWFPGCKTAVKRVIRMVFGSFKRSIPHDFDRAEPLLQASGRGSIPLG